MDARTIKKVDECTNQNKFDFVTKKEKFYENNSKYSKFASNCSLNLVKYTSSDIENLKQKYKSKINLENQDIDYSKIKIRKTFLHEKKDKYKGQERKKQLHVNTKSNVEVNNVSNLNTSSSIESSVRNRSFTSEEELKHLKEVRNENSNFLNNFEHYAADSDSLHNKKITENFKQGGEHVSIKMKESCDFKPSTPEKLLATMDTLVNGVISAEKKNAFQFMMDNRYRSIGRNSSGREASDEPLDLCEQVEQRNKLHSRRDLLQEWANKRGGHKRKIDDYAKDKYIERTLEKRAKRMKNMLSLNKAGTTQQDAHIVKNPIRKSKVLSESEDSNDSAAGLKEFLVETGSTAKDVNQLLIEQDIIFSPPRSKSVGTNEMNNITLSPSLKKNNLLYYFDVKQNNSSPHPALEPMTTHLKEEEPAELIKVKLNFTPKRSKRADQIDENSSKSKELKKSARNKKCTLSLKKNKENNVNQVVSVELDADISQNEIEINTFNPLKSNLNSDDVENIHFVTNDNKCNKLNNLVLLRKNKTEDHVNSKEQEVLKSDVRSISKKRSVKKGQGQDNSRAWKMKLKFIDTEEDSNNTDNREGPVEEVTSHVKETVLIVADDDDDDDVIFPEVRKPVQESTTKKAVKIAPLFLLSRRTEVNEARRRFLQSGSPLALCNSLAGIVSSTDSVPEQTVFPGVSHVQQRELRHADLWDLPGVELPLRRTAADSVFVQVPVGRELTLGTVTGCGRKSTHRRPAPHGQPGRLAGLRQAVTAVKAEHPCYPVYRVFRELWEKGGRDHVSAVPSLPPRKKKRRGRPSKRGGGRSEMPVDPAPGVMLMWTDKYRPVSGGEVAGNAESVFELEAWLRRWAEMGGGHSVSPRTDSSGNEFCSDNEDGGRGVSGDPSQLASALMLVGPHGTGKTSSVYAVCCQLHINVIEINASSRRPGKKLLLEHQEATKSHGVKVGHDRQTTHGARQLSLLLIEEADVVYDEQDDGFTSALATLISSSRRPIVVTASDPDSQHLQRLMALLRVRVRVLEWKGVGGPMAAPRLRLLCLVEGLHVPSDDVTRLLDANCGDLRRTLLQLQLWLCSGGGGDCASIHQLAAHTTASEQDLCSDEEAELPWLEVEAGESEKGGYGGGDGECERLFTGWLERDADEPGLPYPVQLEEVWHATLPSTSPFHRHLVEALDALSLADPVHRRLGQQQDWRPCRASWRTSPKDGLSLEYALNEHQPTHETALELQHWLLSHRLPWAADRTRAPLRADAPADRLCEVAALTHQLDRRALHLDYCAALRQMCRSEAGRAGELRRRSGRFYHYLRPFGLHLQEHELSATCHTFAQPQPHLF